MGRARRAGAALDAVLRGICVQPAGRRGPRGVAARRLRAHRDRAGIGAGACPAAGGLRRVARRLDEERRRALPHLPRRCAARDALGPAARAVGMAIALALAVTMAVYVLQPHPLLWFFRASIDRVLIQLWPSVLLATVLALAPQPGGRGRPSSGAGLDAAGASPSPQTRANDR